MDAKNLARDCCAWIRDNPGSFKRIMSVFHEQVDKGNPCTRRDDVINYARDKGFDISVVEELRHDHSLYAGITRYAVMLRPRLARTINFRKSKLDGIDLAEIWHEVVDPDTTFLAKSRKDAEVLVAVDDASAV